MKVRVKQLAEIWKKYRYALLVILAGVLLMASPRLGSRKAQTEAQEDSEPSFSLEQTEARMADILSKIDGVGKLQIMLTISGGTQLQLAADTDRSGGAERQELITLNRGGGYQEVVVTNRIYPAYRGAVVVCQGADSSAVRLAVTEAVSALTGLSSEKITVLKWKQS